MMAHCWFLSIYMFHYLDISWKQNTRLLIKVRYAVLSLVVTVQCFAFTIKGSKEIGQYHFKVGQRTIEQKHWGWRNWGIFRFLFIGIFYRYSFLVVIHNPYYFIFTLYAIRWHALITWSFFILNEYFPWLSLM